MQLKEIVTIVGEILVGLGVLAAGIGYFIHSFTKSGRDEKSEIISSATQMTDFWKSQAENKEKIMAEKDKSNDEKFLSLNKELGEIRGQLIEKEKQNKEYLAILQNRDPETKKFMEYMVQATKDQTEISKEIIRILGEIHVMSKQEHDKEFKIEANVSKV